VWLVRGARIPARRATELLGKHGGETREVPRFAGPLAGRATHLAHWSRPLRGKKRRVRGVPTPHAHAMRVG